MSVSKFHQNDSYFRINSPQIFFIALVFLKCEFHNPAPLTTKSTIMYQKQQEKIELVGLNYSSKMFLWGKVIQLVLRWHWNEWNCSGNKYCYYPFRYLVTCQHPDTLRFLAARTFCSCVGAVTIAAPNFCTNNIYMSALHKQTLKKVHGWKSNFSINVSSSREKKRWDQFYWLLLKNINYLFYFLKQ